MLHVGKSSRTMAKYSKDFSKGQYRVSGTHTLELGTYRLHPDNCYITSNFKKAVSELPDSFNADNLYQWLEFFQAYGTHYIFSFRLGGKVEASKKIDSCTSTSAATAAVKDTLNHKAIGNSSKSSSTKGHSQATEKSFIGGGINGPAVFNAEGWEGFKSLANIHPDLLKVGVHSLVSLLKLIDQDKKSKAMAKAIIYYMSIPKGVDDDARATDCVIPEKKTSFFVALAAAIFFFCIVVLVSMYYGPFLDNMRLKYKRTISPKTKQRDTKPKYEGNLTLRTTGKPSKARMFELYGSYLGYVEGEKHERLVLLAECIIEPQRNKKRGFVITTKDNKHFFSASTEEDKDKWIRELNNAKNLVKSKGDIVCAKHNGYWKRAKVMAVPFQDPKTGLYKDCGISFLEGDWDEDMIEGAFWTNIQPYDQSLQSLIQRFHVYLNTDTYSNNELAKTYRKKKSTFQIDNELRNKFMAKVLKDWLRDGNIVKDNGITEIKDDQRIKNIGNKLWKNGYIRSSATSDVIAWDDEKTDEKKTDEKNKEYTVNWFPSDAELKNLGSLMMDRKGDKGGVHFRKGKESFYARDAVTWLRSNSDATSRSAATILGQHMCNKRLLAPTTDEIKYFNDKKQSFHAIH